MTRHKLTVAERILGVEKTLASRATPRQLRPGLRRYLMDLRRRLRRR